VVFRVISNVEHRNIGIERGAVNGTAIAIELINEPGQEAGRNKFMISLSNLRKVFLLSLVALVFLIGTSLEASAQSRRELERERQRIARENARYERERQQRNRTSRNTPQVSRRTEQRVANSNYVNGYQQGLMAGEFDRRKGKYNNSNVYRDTGSYPNQGDPTSGDYIYRQGYLQGYQDGFNGRRNY
jgi:hypothetical protein